MSETNATQSHLPGSSGHGHAYSSPLGSLKGVERFREETYLRRLLGALPLPSDHSFLDIGCGYGQKLKWLRELGINATGVDINYAHVQAVRSEGMKAVSVKEFESSNDVFDGMLMSHIIEHFQPPELLSFMDRHLDRLKVGGYLVIATPMSWVHFFENFDHVRPYPASSILQVFRNDSTQVQFHGRNKIQIVDLAIRRSPYAISTTDLTYAKMHPPGSMWAMRYRLVPAIAKRIYRLSGGVWGGMTTGWAGVFQKRG